MERTPFQSQYKYVNFTHVPSRVHYRVKGRPEAPGKPGKPSVDEQNVDSLRLSWLAPKEDGGSPITQYIVEMRTVR
ncbi:hypothetical protein ANCDUO_23757 [Ancylostoma duodenale]|uniref:Fibronectin type-III domain-containing protein n=1 Tax=Ancylostoma duodenale TaxID=51022 RepID=A0A0C2FMW1_9BILA|nr:hypothetical protein ANCDUO_23757 [Ancylostoma duodenale]